MTKAAGGVVFDRVSKRYGKLTVVDEVSFTVSPGELVTLLGPSGCGKTTTLRMVNRLVEPDAGRILLDGEDVTHIDPVALRLRMGYVIQQTGLFPHLDVAANVATVPRLLGWDRERIRMRVDELLELVGLEPHPFGVVDRLAGVDAEQDVVGLGVLAGEVVGVAGAD